MPVIANQVPQVRLTWTEDAFGFKAPAIAQQLLDGDPSIAVMQPGDREVRISMWMLRPGEHRAVLRRMQEIFARA